jgi:hypothetical protein
MLPPPLELSPPSDDELSLPLELSPPSDDELESPASPLELSAPVLVDSSTPVSDVPTLVSDIVSDAAVELSPGPVVPVSLPPLSVAAAPSSPHAPASATKPIQR